MSRPAAGTVDGESILAAVRTADGRQAGEPVLDLAAMRAFHPLPSLRRVLYGLLLAFLPAVAVAFLLPVSPALSQTIPSLSLTAEPALVRLGSDGRLVVEARLGDVWPDAVLDIELRGPGDPATGPDGFPSAVSLSTEVGDLEGPFRMEVSLSDFEGPARAGAYHVTAALRSPDGRSLESTRWWGLLPSAEQAGGPIDLVTVWPVAYGIHRHPDGSFADRVLLEAVAPVAGSSGLYGLFQAADDFPSWRMSLALEPVLLTQLQEMSDGFVLRPSGEEEVEIAASDPEAELAARALEVLGTVAAQETVQILAAPYAMPSLPLLGAEGWDDGLEQMQLGKSVIQEVLDLADSPDSGYAPGLELTTDSLVYLAGAGLDHVVVAADVAADLVEEPERDGGPVRVRDPDDNRLTFLVASPVLRATLAEPWEPDRFLASVAAEAASGWTGPLVSVPASDYGLPPAEFLQEVGRGLSQSAAVRTLTLEEAVAEHVPPTRPVFLTRYGRNVEGFVGQTYLDRLRSVREAVQIFRQATSGDPAATDRSPLDEILLMLYQAESRYWFAGRPDPAVANLGLSYMNEATALVGAEFDKIDVAGDKSVILMGSGGDVPVAVVNQTGYPVEARLILRGDGLEFSEFDRLDVTLGPQENIFQVPVETGGGSASVQVSVFIGDEQIDEESIEIRSLALDAALPWVLAALAVAALGAGALVYRSRSRPR